MEKLETQTPMTLINYGKDDPLLQDQEEIQTVPPEFTMLEGFEHPHDLEGYNLAGSAAPVQVS